MRMPAIPFFSLQRQMKSLEQQTQAACAQVLETQQFIGGPMVESFEKQLATYLRAPRVISCNSGTDGLWLALKALAIKPESIVITTPFSFIASASEIVAHGAHPVFIDIDEKTFNIDPKKVGAWLEQEAMHTEEKTIHKKTGLPIVGIIAVDLFGQCADYDALRLLATQWKLWIIEDACQAIGASYNDTPAGGLGDIGVFSFYPTKNLGACGDGGACVTHSPELGDSLFKLKNHGRKSHYDYEGLGINSRLDALQAALLSVKLNHLETYNKRRRSLATRYYENLKDVRSITLPEERIGKHVYHQYTITIAAGLREAFINFLKQQGIGTAIYYPKPLHQINFLVNHEVSRSTDCSIAERMSQEVVSLPIWPELTFEELDRVCEVIKQFEQSISVSHTSSNTMKSSALCS